MTNLGEFTEELVLRQARDDYERGEAEVPLCVGSVALLVVDMLDEFVKPQWSPFWVPDATRQAPNIRTLQEACRGLHVPVINIGYATHLRGLDAPAPRQRMPLGRGALPFLSQLFIKPAFYEAVAPQPDDLVILKHTHSSFHGTSLEGVLHNLGVDTVIVAGTMTNYCCGATAREAYWHGFNVVFGSDVNSSDDEECQRAELKTLRRGYARVLTAAEIMQELRESAAAADFDQNLNQRSEEDAS